MENEQDGSEVLETTEETVENTGEEIQQESSEESQEEVLTPEQIAELKAKAAKADELEKKNKQLFERAKKNNAQPKDELAPKDLYALMTNQVPQEDVDEVVRAAKALNIPVPEALKSNIVKGILSERAEERRTSQATQTRGGARGSAKVSGADLLSKAERTGELPDTDEGMVALAQARLLKKLGKKS